MKTTSLFRLAVALVFCGGFNLATQADEPATKLWIIDPHTHFKGPEQISVEAKTAKYHPKNTLGMVMTPEDYRPIADRLGIQSTVVVEAVDQEIPQFNDWVLQQAKSNLICGYIARGDLKSPEFLANYQRYRASGFLKGYRFRREELQGYLESDAARANLKRLEQDGMVVDLLVNSQHAPSIKTLASDYPRLTIVIDHCFGAQLRNGKVLQTWTKAVEDCGKFPNVHCKLSSVLNFDETRPFSKPASTDVTTYLPILQTCFDAFGEDRVMFASNWAVCTHYGKVDDVVKIVSEFLQAQGPQALRKGMRDNAIRVFKIPSEDLR